jgi:4-hydroxy-3-methylbut-2-enyl diphosphate reductase
MLASETNSITEILKSGLIEVFGEENLEVHLADTRDTLCYATSDNQKSTMGLINDGADLTLVVGGYNSSNTSHLVEMCKKHMPTYYIKDAAEITSAKTLRHYCIEQRTVVTTDNWLPTKFKESQTCTIGLTSGASCPDRTVEDVLERLTELHNGSKTLDILAKEL